MNYKDFHVREKNSRLSCHVDDLGPGTAEIMNRVDGAAPSGYDPCWGTESF